MRLTLLSALLLWPVCRGTARELLFWLAYAQPVQSRPLLCRWRRALPRLLSLAYLRERAQITVVMLREQQIEAQLCGEACFAPEGSIPQTQAPSQI